MSLAGEIRSMTEKVTKKWTTQRKREERSTRVRFSRREYMYSTRVNQTDVAEEVIPKAYLKASGNGTLPAMARQIYYAARDEIQERTGRPLDSQYFTQTILPKYINTHPEAAGWWVAYDARGHLIEPHTQTNIPLGTLQVDRYLSDIEKHRVDLAPIKTIKTDYPTKGPTNRISAILFIEKEGFNELFEAVKLAERYDIAIMSTKGQSVVAARKLVDHLCHVGAGCPVLILHDFDKAGLEIAQTLTSVSWAAEEADRVRYRFRYDINFIDLGLRLTDVEEWGLAAEGVKFKGHFAPDSIATPEEQAFLKDNKRVELNAFTSPDFIKWIEAKLKQHGIKKVVPDGETLKGAYRRAFHIAYLNRQIDDMINKAEELAHKAKMPRGLKKQIREALVNRPEDCWDRVLARIAEDRVQDIEDDEDE